MIISYWQKNGKVWKKAFYSVLYTLSISIFLLHYNDDCELSLDFDYDDCTDDRDADDDKDVNHVTYNFW